MPETVVRYAATGNDAPGRAAGPAERLFAVIPHDVDLLPAITIGLHIGTGGDLAVIDLGSKLPVVFKNVSSGTRMPIRVERVLATGTTAADIVGLALSELPIRPGADDGLTPPAGFKFITFNNRAIRHNGKLLIAKVA